MAEYSSKDVIVEVDATAGGALVNITAFVDQVNDLDREAITTEKTPYGATWPQHLYTGIRELKPLVIGGTYNSGASPAPNAVFCDKEGETRTVKVTLGGTKTVTAEMIIKRYKRMVKVKENTRWEVELLPTGAVVEA